jgi:large subunit ribosomal protein L18
MAKGPRYKVPFRRRREGRTDFHQRLRLLISKRPRIIVRTSLRHIRLQLVTPKPEGDFTWVHADSTELARYGYDGPTGNTPAAYLSGLLFGYKAQQTEYNSAILDIGLQESTKGSRIYASLKGIVDAGFDVPHDPVVFPDDQRIRGDIIKEYTNIDIPTVFERALSKIKNEFGDD